MSCVEQLLDPRHDLLAVESDRLLPLLVRQRADAVLELESGQAEGAHAQAIFRATVSGDPTNSAPRGPGIAS